MRFDLASPTFPSIGYFCLMHGMQSSNQATISRTNEAEGCGLIAKESVRQHLADLGYTSTINRCSSITTTSSDPSQGDSLERSDVDMLTHWCGKEWNRLLAAWNIVMDRTDVYWCSYDRRRSPSFERSWTRNLIYPMCKMRYVSIQLVDGLRASFHPWSANYMPYPIAISPSIDGGKTTRSRVLLVAISQVGKSSHIILMNDHYLAFTILFRSL